MCSQFLEENYDEVFDNYQHLLNSSNYVTRRQALKVSSLLSESLSSLSISRLNLSPLFVSLL